MLCGGAAVVLAVSRLLLAVQRSCDQDTVLSLAELQQYTVRHAMLSKLWNLSGKIGFHQNVRAAAAMAQAAAFQTQEINIDETKPHLKS